VPYVLLADQRTYRCRNWDQLVERLVWAHQAGYTTAKARRTTMDSDRPLIPSEAAALVETATKVALDIPEPRQWQPRRALARRPAEPPGE
jgi:hypothetical protein